MVKFEITITFTKILALIALIAIVIIAILLKSATVAEIGIPAIIGAIANQDYQRRKQKEGKTLDQYKPSEDLSKEP